MVGLEDSAHPTGLPSVGFGCLRDTWLGVFVQASLFTTQVTEDREVQGNKAWIPACAGMTVFWGMPLSLMTLHSSLITPP